jgi:hypothetical protein
VELQVHQVLQDQVVLRVRQEQVVLQVQVVHRKFIKQHQQQHIH